MYYTEFAKSISDFLKTKRDVKDYNEANQDYLKSITSYSKSVAWYYSYGSKYDTPFWNNIQKRSNIYLNTQCFSNRYDSMQELFYASYNKRDEDLLSIGCFSYHDYKDVACGMLQRPVQKVLEDVFDYPLDALDIDDDIVDTKDDDDV